MSCTSAQSKPGPATSWKGPPPPKAPCHPRAGAGSLTIGRRRHQSVPRKRMAGFLLRVGLVCWPAKSMTAAQPRVASRAAPHGGAPAYHARPAVPRLANKGGAGDAQGADCGRRTALKYHDSLRSFSKHPKGGRAVCSAAEQGPDRAGVCT